jgi:ABC-type glycerol-3-phosphate transport system permease component
MKRTVVLCAAALLLIASAVYTFGDIARPKATPTPAPGKVVFHTGLQIVPDSKSYEARLQISQATLERIREATTNTSANTSMTQRIMQSSTRTVMAGIFMFLAISFAGVWLARSSQRRSQKGIAAVLLVVGMLGAATVIVRANAGPPGYYYWQNLPQNLTKGQPTRGGLDIEIVPGDDGIKLIIPMKSTPKPGEE